MESPPTNRLLQLLRQKPSDSLLPDHGAPASSPSFDPFSSYNKSNTQPVTESNTQPVTESSTQPAKSNTQPATLDDILSTTKSDIQPVISGTQSATKSDIQPATKSDIQYATKNSTQPATNQDKKDAIIDNPHVFVTGLSKGQERVIRYLKSLCKASSSDQTKAIGYEAISRDCSLSRSGTRKIIDELIKKRIIIRSETKRGEEQGSIYTVLINQEHSTIEDSIQSVPKSNIQSVPKSNIQPVTLDPSSSSSNKNKLLLLDLIFEDAFQNLNPQSLSPYLENFTTCEELQNFLDMANACIAAAKQGKSKPIQNAHGFLFAQLRAGYINPPEGYKSRRLRAQEARNQQLREELERLKKLQEEEHHLRFSIFVTALTAEDEQRLNHEIQQRIDHKGMLSPEFQTRLLREQILQEWFIQKNSGVPLKT